MLMVHGVDSHTVKWKSLAQCSACCAACPVYIQWRPHPFTANSHTYDVCKIVVFTQHLSHVVAALAFHPVPRQVELLQCDVVLYIYEWCMCHYQYVQSHRPNHHHFVASHAANRTIIWRDDGKAPPPPVAKKKKQNANVGYSLQYVGDSFWNVDIPQPYNRLLTVTRIWLWVLTCASGKYVYTRSAYTFRTLAMALVPAGPRPWFLITISVSVMCLEK